MQLSDRTIRRLLGHGFLEIEPRPKDVAFQPATVDLTLGALASHVPGFRGLPHALRPGEFLLGSTLEVVRLPRDLAAQVKGKSTWARRGLMVECAGFIDPRFRGNIVLEIKNLHETDDILLQYEDRICQIAFYKTDAPCDRGYGDPELDSHYQDQHGVTPAAE